jgi:hypothetical protein
MSRFPRLTSLLAVACAAFTPAVSLALAPAADATTYGFKGAFDENHGLLPLGLAVDQSNDHVYVANHSELGGIYQFESSGTPVPPEPFAAGEQYAGVAVDPENHNVYAYNDGAQEIQTFEPSPSGTEVRHFTVSGGTGKFVHIASDSAGDIYYPNRAVNSVQEFEPEANGASPTPVLTIAGTGEHALVEPTGVAVDSIRGDVYVVDKIATVGRVQIFNPNASPPTESTLDEAGSQDVAVDPVSGDVFALDLNEEGSCVPLSGSCYRVRAYHTGEATAFAEFGAGIINTEGDPTRLAVDHNTGDVYVSVSGEAQHKVLIFAPETPPQVTYPAPSVTGVSASAATLHGEVNPEGNKTSCHFEYGTSKAYGVSMPCTELVGEGKTFTPEAVTISGLKANTEYHFRLVATTTGGTVVDGVDQPFTTHQAPAIDSASVINLTTTSADLTAQINPNGSGTTYRFEWGTSTSYGTNVPIPDADIGSGMSDVAATTHLSGLGANTTYHWRILATSANGTTGATADHSFTTLKEPSLPEPVVTVPLVLVQPLTPAPLAIAPVVFPAETGTVSPPKPLTRAQKLAKALKQCRKDKSRKKRKACEKTASHRYASKPKPKKK